MSATNSEDRLIEALRSDEYQPRYDALETLANETISKETAKEVLPDLLEFMGGTHAMWKLKSIEAISKLASYHPTAFRSLPDSAFDPILRYFDSDSCGDSGPVACALGASGRFDAIEAIHERHEEIYGAAAAEIQRGLEIATETLIQNLLAEDVPSDSSTGDGLRLLAKHHPMLVVEWETELFDLLESPNGDIAVDAFVEILATEAGSELSETTLVEAIDVSPDSSPELIQAAANGLDAMLRSDTRIDAVKNAMSEALEWLESDDTTVQKKSFELLTPISTHAPSLLSGNLPRSPNSLSRPTRSAARPWSSSSATRLQSPRMRNRTSKRYSSQLVASQHTVGWQNRSRCSATKKEATGSLSRSANLERP
ncbi:hypothetical protein ACFQH3_20290 [Haladaptatus sp. GCM10025707]|uniref:hypothetical protein n=1 Tax=Haladaptatus sp. GCM10025707 TaxID=3252658 RepID=UPI0036191E50